LGERDTAVGAGKALGEEHGLRCSGLFGWGDRTAPPRPPDLRRGATTAAIARRFDLNDAVREAERGLERIGQPHAEAVLHDEPIDDDLDGVLALLVELDVLTELAHDAVHANAREALALQIEEELLVLTLPAAHHGRQHQQARADRLQKHAID